MSIGRVARHFELVEGQEAGVRFLLHLGVSTVVMSQLALAQKCE